MATVRRKCWYTCRMDRNARPLPFGWLASVPRVVKRLLGRKAKPAVEREHPPLRDKPGPSGLPPAPPRIGVKGL